MEKPEEATQHCLRAHPYRMVVFIKNSTHGVPLYQVAGSAAAPCKAEKALKEAHRVHGGGCFYCKQPVKDLTIDHAEPLALGGSQTLQNLLIACKSCNISKGHRPIEAFKPAAGREWLNALLQQVETRLSRL